MASFKIIVGEDLIHKIIHGTLIRSMSVIFCLLHHQFVYLLQGHLEREYRRGEATQHLQQIGGMPWPSWLVLLDLR
jgi:hypothetical protein